MSEETNRAEEFNLKLNLHIRNMMRLFLDSIMDYERESRSAICYDERDSVEFVDLFIDSEDAFDLSHIYENRKQYAQEQVKEALLTEIPKFMRWTDEGAGIDVNKNDFEAFKEIAQDYYEKEVAPKYK